MNFLEKIARSWWVLLSFIIFLNGFGFIYISVKYNNKNWLLEGIMYELPWFLYFIVFAYFGTPIGLNPSFLIIVLAVLLLFVSVIRSIWVAVKLADVYDNEEKYTIQSTDLNKQKVNQENDNSKTTVGCCLCLIVIFIFFLIVVL